MIPPLVFIDTETTSLDPLLGEIWEVAAICRNTQAVDIERHWMLPVDLEHADRDSLEIGGFHDRHPQGNRYAFTEPEAEITPLLDFAKEFTELTDRAHLVGAVVSFDEQRLWRLIETLPFHPSWHYHLVDVEALLAGKYRIEPPWNSKELSALAGVKPPDDIERHTALGDARWAARLYDAAMEDLA